jgi:hypothetical protein
MKRSTNRTINELFELNKEILEGIIIIMATMQDLVSAVQNESTVDDSIITLLNGISQQLKDALAQNDPNAIQAVIDQVNANSKKLSDAVAANTPAAPAPTA